MTFSNSKWTAVQGRILPLILALLLSLSILPGCSGESGVESSSPENSASIEQPAAEEEVAAPEAAGDGEATLDVSQLLGYIGSPYVVIADNVPGLTEADAEGVTESYSPLVARGVQMEALSLGDGGQGVSFNVYCYNVKPGVSIDYATGESWRSDQQGAALSSSQEMDYVLNTSSKKFHLPGCSSVDRMAEKNKQAYTGIRDDLLSQGYDPCGNCNP